MNGAWAFSIFMHASYDNKVSWHYKNSIKDVWRPLIIPAALPDPLSQTSEAIAI